MALQSKHRIPIEGDDFIFIIFMGKIRHRVYVRLLMILLGAWMVGWQLRADRMPAVATNCDGGEVRMAGMDIDGSSH